ncbi:DEAD/DEAH box helicase [Flaviaesturariibacter amylovorans]|uniref:DEAD/DEAH box helicase n=1 Tax=Flaviaesturariibacter amylovorans TaxID=1084520 RepID=A0ABP8HNJ4_9BACT
MAHTYSIKDLQEALLGGAPQPAPATGERALLLVLRHYRFHKVLSIELYEATLTAAGKPRNPLLPVNPLDRIPRTGDPAVLQFLAAVSRFQKDPTAPRTPADIEALRLVLRNPAGLPIYAHDAGFSDNPTAGSLTPVGFGAPITDATLLVTRRGDTYTCTPQLPIGGRMIPLEETDIAFEHFVRGTEAWHLLASFPLFRLVRFFRGLRGPLQLPAAHFPEFRRLVLDPLGDLLTVHYTGVQPATEVQRAEAGGDAPPERFLYLSDSGAHIALTPVARYGNTDVPVLSKRQVYAQDRSGQWFCLERNEEAEVAFTALLLRQHPDFERQLDTDPLAFYLHRSRFLENDWFLGAFADWQEAGITVLGFGDLKGIRTSPHTASVSVQVRSGIDWFGATVKLRFGKQTAALKQLQQAVRAKSRYIPLGDGTQGLLPEAWLERFAAWFEAGDTESEELRIPKVQFATVAELFREDELDREALAELRYYQQHFTRPEAVPNVPVPATFRGTLRHYQQEGLNWLQLLAAGGFGGCLADDMGLGKTVQVLAFLLAEADTDGPHTSLVVVPNSLLFNWQAEAQRFAPTLRLHLHYGERRLRHIRDFDRFDLVLTTYGTLLQDISYLKNYGFRHVFLDESQAIKNIESQRYAAARLLQARTRFAITGTPVENNTLDLYAQLSFACPGLLGSKRSFKQLFSIPIDQFQSSRHARQLQQRVAPFLLRRTKKEVAPELPEKTELLLSCPMDESQQRIYDACARELRDFIEGKADDELKRSSVFLLRGLTRLRQICNAPQLLPEEKQWNGTSSKIEALVEGIVNNAPGHKILVFSQFVSMLDLIRAELEKRQIPSEVLTGSTRDRAGAVQRFETDERTRVFLISLKAGGTGLNLTSADYVYLVDPWWNPAVEDQAIDRAYRIGQDKKVVAVRLYCPGTVEEKIRHLQAAKRALSGELIGGSPGFLASITRSEWRELLGPLASPTGGGGLTKR